jgi:hypothetical protein
MKSHIDLDKLNADIIDTQARLIGCYREETDSLKAQNQVLENLLKLSDTIIKLLEKEKELAVKAACQPSMN